MKTILVSGGAGFIGSALVRHLINNTDSIVVNVDKLTYAGNLDSLKSIEKNNRYIFQQVDICDVNKLQKVFEKYEPDMVMHLAAESHVDKSIDSPIDFINTNILGTAQMLECSRVLMNSSKANKSFKFHHISTDEVFGDLAKTEKLFSETTRYDPSSPYSATKASSDHLVRSWGRTYGLPYVITNCSNNYGPFQFPEKFIPNMIISALSGENLPIYGDGKQIRDWLYVDDHVEALHLVATKGIIGETYNIGGMNEMQNIDLARMVCRILGDFIPSNGLNLESYDQLIKFVHDRPGHDLRYAIDCSKIHKELGWQPRETLESGLYKTIRWYIDNDAWLQAILNGDYVSQRQGLKS